MDGRTVNLKANKKTLLIMPSRLKVLITPAEELFDFKMETYNDMFLTIIDKDGAETYSSSVKVEAFFENNGSIMPPCICKTN